VLFVSQPPINSIIVKLKFNRKAHPILFELFE